MTARRYNPLSQCIGKRPYSSKRDAKAVARKSERHGVGRTHAYRCPTCAQWHVGHKPPPYDWNDHDAD